MSNQGFRRSRKTMVTCSFRSNAPFRHFPRWRLSIVRVLLLSVPETEERIRYYIFVMSRCPKYLNIDVCTWITSVSDHASGHFEYALKLHCDAHNSATQEVCISCVVSNHRFRRSRKTMVTFSFRLNAPFRHFPRWRLNIVQVLIGASNWFPKRKSVLNTKRFWCVGTQST